MVKLAILPTPTVFLPFSTTVLYVTRSARNTATFTTTITTIYSGTKWESCPLPRLPPHSHCGSIFLPSGSITGACTDWAAIVTSRAASQHRLP